MSLTYQGKTLDMAKKYIYINTAMSNLAKRDDDEEFIETEDVQTFVSLASLSSRDFLAKFVMARQDCGERIRDIVKTMNRMNIKVSERSLYRYASNVWFCD